MSGISRKWRVCLAASTVAVGMVSPAAAQQGFSPVGKTAAENAQQEVFEVELVTERYPNRAIKIERHVALDAKRNFVNHGLWTMYSPDGTMLARGEYWQGVRQGKWTRWLVDEPAAEAPSVTDELGDEAADAPASAIGVEFEGFSKPFRSEANFVDGKLVGTWAIIDSDNRTICSYEFDRDKLHGAAVWYYPTGQQRRLMNFENNVVIDELKEWNPDGSVARTESFVNGRRKAPYTENYDTGEKHCEGFYLYAPGTVTVGDEGWEGVVNFRIAEDDEEKVKHGIWTYWYRNGGKMTEGEYDNGKQVGLHIWWYENGQQMSQGEFVDGLQSGDWIWWHENGLKKTEGQVVEGQKVGRWSEWHEDGTLAVERHHGGATPTVRNATASPAVPPAPSAQMAIPNPGTGSWQLRFPTKRTTAARP